MEVKNEYILTGLSLRFVVILKQFITKKGLAPGSRLFWLKLDLKNKSLVPLRPVKIYSLINCHIGASPSHLGI